MRKFASIEEAKEEISFWFSSGDEKHSILDERFGKCKECLRNFGDHGATMSFMYAGIRFTVVMIKYKDFDMNFRRVD